MQAHATLLPPTWSTELGSPERGSHPGCGTTNLCAIPSHDPLSPHELSHDGASSIQAIPSPVQLPEIIDIICSYLSSADLAAAARVNSAWYDISIPLLYRELALLRTHKYHSLVLGVSRNGHLCRKLTASREVNHWCPWIIAMLRNMPNLIELDTTWMNADILEPLAYLQKLERLSISRLQGSMSDDNEYFVPSFKGSSKLKELNMAYSSQMTDSAFVSITRTCRQIEVLNVEGDCRLTHEGLIAWCDQLAADAAAAEGENDHDDDATALTGQRRSMGAGVGVGGTLRFETGVGQVGMTHLTTVRFANCNRIQTDGFQVLFERSRHLQNVDLMATRIGDEALHTLSTRNAGLHTLNLNCCPNISDQGLQSVLRTSRQLRVVSFLGCNRITVRVFFQSVWKCLDLQVLRFSLNARHADLISHGVAVVQGTNPQDTTTTTTATTATTTTEQVVSNYFYEPQFEFMVFGKPDPEDDPQQQQQQQQHINSDILNISVGQTPPLSCHQDENAGSPLGAAAAAAAAAVAAVAAPSQWASVQEYRQYQIVSQVYRQIERLKQLQTLDMRNIHLPLDMASGLHRLGHLKELQVLMLTGLERPLGELEIAWLTNTIHQEDMPLQDDDTPLFKEVPLPQLRELVFKNCQGLSVDLLKQLKNCRPSIDVQMT